MDIAWSQPLHVGPLSQTQYQFWYVGQWLTTNLTSLDFPDYNRLWFISIMDQSMPCLSLAASLYRGGIDPVWFAVVKYWSYGCSCGSAFP